jgi:hypothetical protein
MENTMKATRKIAVATSVFAFAAMFSLGWSDQGGISLSVDSAQAQGRINVYRMGRPSNYAVYRLDGSIPWYAVRAYYLGGPWSGLPANGVPYHWNGWADYAAQNGIGCTPGTIVKGLDGIDYACQ